MSLRLHLKVFAVSFFLILMWIVATFSSAISIANCDNTDIVEYLEGRSSPYVTCYGSGDNTSTITWTLLDNTGLTKNLATCHGLNNCTTLYSSSLLQVTWSTAKKSYIYLPRFAREFSGTVTCTETRETSEDSASCALKLTHAALLNNCSSEVIRETWSFLVSCDVTKFWSSRGRYEFRVLEDFNVRKRGEFVSADTYTFPGRRSFRGSLSLYTDPADSKLYYRGRLNHSWPISPVPGTYLGFKLYTYPPERKSKYYERPISPYPHTQWTHINQNLNITSPSEPHHNCTEHTDMRDATVVPCVCSTDYLGSPAGRLVWLLGDIVIATGDNGVNELKLPSEKLVKGHNGMTARCQLDWVKPLTVSLPFVLNVGVTAKPAAALSDEGMMGLAVAGWMLFAVVVVVAVVVAVVIRRRRKYGIGCCGESLYDRPKRDTDEVNGGYSDFNVYQQTRAASNEGNQSGVTERVYQNLAMGQTGGHM